MVARAAAAERARGGFTLIEAIVAMTISTAVVLMAAGVFLAQNDFYSFLLQESRAQDNSRSILRVVEAELGSLAGGALVSADSTHVVFRTPQTLGGVCAVQGSDGYVHWASSETLEPSDATGFAARDSLGAWTFQSASVGSAVQDWGTTSATVCALAGADTARATGDFSRVVNLASYVPGFPAPGDVIMVYEEVELRVQTSVLDPNKLALYRGPAGGTLTEYTTGVAPEAKFLFRVGGSWRSSVSSGSLAAVEAIRVQASSFEPAESGTGTPTDFELTVDLPLRNR